MVDIQTVSIVIASASVVTGVIDQDDHPQR